MSYLGAGAKSTLTDTTPSTANVALPSNVSGDFLLMVWASYVGDSTLTGPSGWTGPIGNERSSSGQSDLLLFYKVSNGSEPSTVSISNTGQASGLNSGEARIYNYGQATVEASGSWSASGAGTTITLASLTSGGTGRLRVDVYGRFGASVAANPFTHTAGSTEREDGYYGMSDIAVTSAGADSGRTCTATDGSGWLQSVSLLLVDSGGGGGGSAIGAGLSSSPLLSGRLLRGLVR